MNNWKKILVVAVHPDDETLGCGATLLRLGQMNKELHWLILTTSAGSKIFGKEYGEKEDRKLSK
ncbi:MAG: PIG-L family deacetylase [Chitinophagaceae bacterium]|nr:PIG-L family deacetylase [Chitinophagaceae bacterium]